MENTNLKNWSTILIDLIDDLLIDGGLIWNKKKKQTFSPQ